MSLTDDDISTEWRSTAPPVLGSSQGPTEREDDLDVGGEGEADTGDEAGGPTEREDDLDKGGEGDADTGDN